VASIALVPFRCESLYEIDAPLSYVVLCSCVSLEAFTALMFQVKVL